MVASVATPAIAAALPYVGPIASGIGAIAGAFSSGSKGPSLREQLQSQQEWALVHEAGSFEQKMALAKAHGLHPLSVLGVPSSGFSPVLSVPQSEGRDYAAIGAGINSMAGAFVKPPDDKPVAVDPIAERAAMANLRILEAQATRAEWEALGTEWKVADYAAPRILLGQPGNPPAARASNDVVEMQRLAAEQAGLSPDLFRGGTNPITLEQSVLPPHPVKMGHGAATDQAHVTVMGADGKPGSVLNQNAIQAEFNDGATMTLLTRMFGVDTAIEIMAALEQKGIFGAAALGLGAAGKLFYDRMAKQRAAAMKRRPKRSRAVPRARDARGRFVRGGD